MVWGRPIGRPFILVVVVYSPDPAGADPGAKATANALVRVGHVLEPAL